MIMTYESQIRATFNDTIKYQELLRRFFDSHEKHNSCVDEGEREDFFKLLANGLLGIDFEKNCKISLPDKTKIYVSNVGEFLRYLAYYNSSVVGVDFLRRYGKSIVSSVCIADIWRGIKFVVFGIYPEALAMSIRISKEQKKTSGSRGVYVGPRDVSKFTG